MIPAFEPSGNLPAGIHLASWKEITTRYATTGHRRVLLAGFLRGTKLLVSARCAAVYLDGSFAAAKPHPKDFDACWDMVGVDLAFLKQAEPIFFNFSNKRAAQKAKFSGEFFPAEAAADAHRRTFLEFFQQDSSTGLPKGIIRVDLGTLP